KPNPLEPSVFATSAPPEIAEPHGRSSYAVVEAIGDPIHNGEKATIYAEGHALYPRPTADEEKVLRKVADKIPAVSFALCLVEFAERASYYGVSTIFNNFLQFPLPAGGNGAGAPPVGTQETAGALNKGLTFANAFVLLFTFLAYVVPLYGAWLADTRLGRYKVIAIGVFLCGVAHVILVISGIPSILQAGRGIAPFMVGFFILAFGAGLFKPNIAPTVIDQYQNQIAYVKVIPGTAKRAEERVIVDPETTIQRMMLIFYGLINVGAFYAIACTYAEKYVGYWLAFLLPGIIYFLLPILLVAYYKKTKKVAPNKSAYKSTYTIIWVALSQNGWKLWKLFRRNGFWDAAIPSKMRAAGIFEHKGQPIAWTDVETDDVKRTFTACQVFLYFAIYNLNDGGIGSVLSSQGSTMTTNGAPNDLLNNFNPLTIIVTIPLLSYVIYPTLNKWRIPFGRITRITTGFTLAWISGVIGAIIQWRIYKTSPCGYYATGCTVGTGVSPLSIWLQVPNVSLGAISECLCNVTAYELAYARSPKSMRGLVMSLFLFTNALSSALGEIVSPAITDPYLIWIWAGPAIAMAALTVHFYWTFKDLDTDTFMNEQNVSVLPGATESVVGDEESGVVGVSETTDNVGKNVVAHIKAA
ncbi:Peptide transporter PTR2, partial [Lachnellula suecica]